MASHANIVIGHLFGQTYFPTCLLASMKADGTRMCELTGNIKFRLSSVTSKCEAWLRCDTMTAATVCDYDAAAAQYAKDHKEYLRMRVQSRTVHMPVPSLRASQHVYLKLAHNVKFVATHVSYEDVDRVWQPDTAEWRPLSRRDVPSGAMVRVVAAPLFSTSPHSSGIVWIAHCIKFERASVAINEDPTCIAATAHELATSVSDPDPVATTDMSA